MKKIWHSLLTKYIILIFIALGFLQLVMIVYMVGINFERLVSDVPSLQEFEESWTEDVYGATLDDVESIVEKWHADYPQASFFYVNADGELMKKWGKHISTNIPEHWDMVATTRFIQAHYNSPTFTVIRFVGNEDANGFLVLQMERTTLEPAKMASGFIYVAFFLMFAFLAISLLFFIRILKRLVNLEEAMTIREVDGLPIRTEVKKKDEIGAVEQAFNNMVDELREAKKREQEEEQLRRELIANLSHDLNTPLTKMRAQLQNVSAEQAEHLDHSISTMSNLIENLMSYSLLTANKMRYEPQDVRVDRLVNQSIASWYPLFEEQEFDVELEVEELVWHIDQVWLERILDNLFQNVLRHANDGKFIRLDVQDNHIMVKDKGQGFTEHAHTKGAGIGLSIVGLMAEKMNLAFVINSTGAGTTIQLHPKDES
ncbi:hypothetical protein J6TS1_20650 [Siminovitchia terrae]|uniref:histidine kinase n=1 Tax=Siminovitchia terrae TaxID=1914933 RepID=A0A429X5L3_SIMTE|nr:HAMP domain-containing sensor histidine kinase [Siminovitchia terrae]RST58662.1 HAMP domain-containing histidine kinase [Siminovitchia terrae]GIN92670.1 hypothetical protein J22TS1_37210 [Siminovitchia terrae]GIN96195.1 hypothetical protein J6TS1_20650 [Siminovitchia terrae]